MSSISILGNFQDGRENGSKCITCCLREKASTSICKRLKWIYPEETKRQLVFSFLAVKPNCWAGFQKEIISEVERMGQVQDLKISLITFKEKETSFHFSKVDRVIKISPSES